MPTLPTRIKLCPACERLLADSYDLKKIPVMLAYYADKGCEVRTLAEYQKGDL